MSLPNSQLFATVCPDLRVVLAGFLLALPLGLSAGDSGAKETRENKPAEPAPLEARFYQEKAPLAGEITRAILVAQSNQFSMVLPADFRAEVDSSRKRLTLTATDFSCAITLQVHEWAFEGKADLRPDTLRPDVLARFPDGRVTDDFSATIESQSGPGFEVQWATSQGMKMITRVAFVPCSGGHLEVCLQGPSQRVTERGFLLNHLLLSLRSGPLNSKLPVQTLLSEL